jgi:hypothetical protein
VMASPRRNDMTLKWDLAAAFLAGLPVVMLAAPGSAQETKEVVTRTVSNDLLEKVLADLNISHQKTAGKTSNTFFYNYERNNFKIRLGNHGGQVLWLSAAFPKVPLEQINTWNVRAKFSRAVLYREGGSDTSLVEAQLDCRGGMTAGIVRQFLKRFDNEVSDFSSFLKAAH